MWKVIILSVIAVIIIGRWIYRELNTKNVVDYNANGKLKMFGKTRFNKRFGLFLISDEEQSTLLKLYYDRYSLLAKEEHFNVHGHWKTVVYKNGYGEEFIDLLYTEDTLKKDRGFILQAVKSQSQSYEDIPAEFRNDREIILEAVKHDSYIFRKMAPIFRNDREIVLAAIKRNGWLLEYLSKDFKNDKDIVLLAIKTDGSIVKFAGDELKSNIPALKYLVNNSDSFNKTSLFAIIYGFIWFDTNFRIIKTELFDTIKDLNDLKIDYKYIKIQKSINLFWFFCNKIKIDLILHFCSLVCLVCLIVLPFYYLNGSLIIIGFLCELVVVYVVLGPLLMWAYYLKTMYTLKKWLKTDEV